MFLQKKPLSATCSLRCCDVKMNISVKIFPIANLCDSKQEFEAALAEGALSELLVHLNERFGADFRRGDVMLLHNGRSIDLNAEAKLQNGDKVWLMPHLSGG